MVFSLVYYEFEINAREDKRDNQKWIIQRNWQHRRERISLGEFIPVISS
jgi:hypothetical protein